MKVNVNHKSDNGEMYSPPGAVTVAPVVASELRGRRGPLTRAERIAVENAETSDKVLEHAARVLDVAHEQLKTINHLLSMLERATKGMIGKSELPAGELGELRPHDVAECRFTASQVAVIIGDGTGARAVGKIATDIKLEADPTMRDPATKLFSLAGAAAVRAEREKRKRLNPGNFKQAKRAGT